MSWLLFAYVLSVVAAVCCHEVIHWMTAKVFHMKPSITLDYKIIPAVSYNNSGNDFHNLLVSISAPTTLTIIGFLVNWQLAYLIVFKVMCLANVFNLLPFTNDGQVALLSVVNLIRSHKAAL